VDQVLATIASGGYRACAVCLARHDAFGGDDAQARHCARLLRHILLQIRGESALPDRRAYYQVPTRRGAYAAVVTVVYQVLPFILLFALLALLVLLFWWLRFVPQCEIEWVNISDFRSVLCQLLRRGLAQRIAAHRPGYTLAYSLARRIELIGCAIVNRARMRGDLALQKAKNPLIPCVISTSFFSG
jgi:hypothetical protein